MVIQDEGELLRRKAELARLLRHRLNPAWFEFGGNERLAMVFDLEMHLAFLGEAVRLRVPRLFTEYVAWTYQLLATAHGDVDRFEACLRAIAELLRESGRGDWVAEALSDMEAACATMRTAPAPDTSYWSDDNPHRALGEAFLDACVHLRRSQAAALVQQAIRDGVPVPEIYTGVITPAMRELGRLWHQNRLTVAQEHYCTAVAQMVMAQLFPVIFDNDRKPIGRIVSACVAGELHEIGARMVADLFEMAGWDTAFLGADVPRESVVDMLVETEAQVLAISVTLAANLSDASALIAAVRASPACAAVKILVGGAAFNVEPTLWRQMGCDGWAPDPGTALELADRWRT
ncbi:B12-binding domain-containing protein [Ideonella sp. A 288]|uniref:cobalamin B12-binding domain-containing protein n=1 Tax=Ideonella sp. A 288 TaxID=1962181 RepID=UPI000B4B195D|nr:cobalamin-dependent protein [Ideonella sp. A 288]